jgi:IS30 family transposase
MVKRGVESNNNRIRRFLPRETKLDELGDSDIYGISIIMNNTPRKCLGFKTPQEVLNEHLQQSA